MNSDKKYRDKVTGQAFCAGCLQDTDQTFWVYKKGRFGAKRFCERCYKAYMKSVAPPPIRKR